MLDLHSINNEKIPAYKTEIHAGEAASKNLVNNNFRYPLLLVLIILCPDDLGKAHLCVYYAR